MFKQISQMLAYRRMLNSEPENLRVRQATTPDLVKRAKALHSKVFLDHGYVSATYVENGLINEIEDPYQRHAHYFVTERQKGHDDWEVVACARLIFSDANKLHNSFQTVVNQELIAEHKAMLNAQDASSIFEVSALAKERGESTIAVLMLYRAMWQYSIRHGCRYWIMSCDARLYGRLHFMFGDALTVIGKPVYFKGHDVVPALLDIDDSMRVFLKQTRSVNPAKRAMKVAFVRFFLRGLPDAQSLPRHKPLSDVGIDNLS